VKCNLCGQEFANSEDVNRHKEQVHPMGEEGEAPDLVPTPAISGLTPEESAEPPQQRDR
jgi:hypothetical protein